MFKPSRIRLIIINLIINLITNLITTRLMLGIHRCHFPSAGADGGAEAGMVEAGTAAGTTEKLISDGDRIHLFEPLEPGY